jgi:hypothetical protein
MSLADRLEYMPIVLASFTTPNDSVIQELAGRVSGKAGGAAAAFNNADAVKFLHALYDSLCENRIAYQSPPSFVNGAQFGQHIKLGRDVLRNHAGTCIDLAILWASTCEAVGLKPVLIVIPGHCFPAVYLPEGQLVAIEATGVGKCNFEKALEIGNEELQRARQSESIQVDVMAQRKAGVQSLDLPTASPTFLTDMGYHFDATSRTTTQQQAAQQQTDEADDSRSTAATPSVVGVWGFTGQLPVGNVDVGLALTAQGKMAFVIISKGPNGQQSVKSVGHWQASGNMLVLTDENMTQRFQYQLQGDQLSVYFPGLQSWVNFRRVQSNS